MPSPVLVREALAAAGTDPAVIRAAVAVAAAMGEASGAESPGAGELAQRSGLSLPEVGGGLEALRGAGLVVRERGREVLDPDLLCALPMVSAIEWATCRAELDGVRARLAPALAVLRSLARLSRRAREQGGDWVATSVQDLAEETLYGRTAVTQALGDLVGSGLLARAQQPPRRGLKVRITGRAMAAQPASADEGAPARAEGSARQPAMHADGGGRGVALEVGGARVEVPAGSRLALPEGMNYRLEIGPDGAATIRID